MTQLQGATIGANRPLLEPPSSDDRPYRRFGILVLLVSFGLFGAWSATAPLDSAVIAGGQVKVEARRKTVQHLEGGIVAAIEVKDGDRVDAGQILVRLSDVRAHAQLEIVRLQLFDDYGLEARLKAEREDAPSITFPPALLDKKTDSEVAETLRGQTEVFQARRKSWLNENKILKQRIGQLKEQISGLQALVRSEQSRIQSYRSEVTEWESLYKQKLVDKLRLLQIKRELAQLEGDEASNQAQIARLQIQIGETESQVVLREQQRLSETVEQLRKTQSEIADLRTRLVAMEDTLERTLIRSPVRGTVVGLNVHTIGAVLGPGTPIMDVVPVSDDFIIEAMISTRDIDKVRKGLHADVRFSAFNVRFTHVIPGQVENVSADSFQDQRTGAPYYRADVLVTPEGMESMKEYGFQLIPGMPAEVVIKTGERTVLEYLLKPFLDMLARSFREE